MTASAHTRKSGATPPGLAKPSVNNDDALSRHACNTLMSSSTAQNINAKPTKTSKSHVPWNTRSVSGGRME